jgi:hypothetical protein
MYTFVSVGAGERGNVDFTLPPGGRTPSVPATMLSVGVAGKMGQVTSRQSFGHEVPTRSATGRSTCPRWCALRLITHESFVCTTRWARRACAATFDGVVTGKFRTTAVTTTWRKSNARIHKLRAGFIEQCELRLMSGIRLRLCLNDGTMKTMRTADRVRDTYEAQNGGLHVETAVWLSYESGRPDSNRRRPAWEA